MPNYFHFRAWVMRIHHCAICICEYSELSYIITAHILLTDVFVKAWYPLETSGIEKKKGGVRRAHDQMTSSFMRPDILYPFRNSASATDPATFNLKHFFQPLPSRFIDFVFISAK